MIPHNAPQKPRLSIVTTLPALTVEIDGVNYEVSHPDGLSLPKLRRAEMGLPRVSHLIQLADPNDVQEQELHDLLTSLTEQVLGAPKTVIARMTDAQKLAVLEVFAGARGQSDSVREGQDPPRPARKRRRAAARRR